MRWSIRWKRVWERSNVSKRATGIILALRCLVCSRVLWSIGITLIGALGEEALLLTEHRFYSHEPKIEFIKPILEESIPKSGAMKRFGIESKTQVKTWCRLYREDRPYALLPKLKGRPKQSEQVFAMREEEFETRMQKFELANCILTRAGSTSNLPTKNE